MLFRSKTGFELEGGLEVQADWAGTLEAVVESSAVALALDTVKPPAAGAGGGSGGGTGGAASGQTAITIAPVVSGAGGNGLGQILLGGAKGGGLIAAQLFGQWSALACAAATFLLLRTSGGKLGLSPFAAFLGVIGTELFFEAEFAKNDWAVVLWGLAALVYAHEGRYRAGALVAGFAFAIKISSVFFQIGRAHV